MFFLSDNQPAQSAELSLDIQPMQAIPEFGHDSPEPLTANKTTWELNGHPMHVESNTSSMIKLDAEASEGESLDSEVLLAVQEANRLEAMANRNDPTRASQDIAESMLRDKTHEDSTHILAQQIESLHDME